MNLADLGKTVISYGAPLLGTLLGSPAAGIVGQLIANEFGGKTDTENDITTLAQKLTTDPETRVKLAEIESNQKIELQRLLISSEKNRLDNETQIKALDNENTKDARSFNSITKSYFPEILSILIVIGFFACIYWIALYKQEDQDHDVLYMLLGVIGTSFGAVVNYWLGSSYQKYSLTKEK